jgi:hypothetical protein
MPVIFDLSKFSKILVRTQNQLLGKSGEEGRVKREERRGLTFCSIASFVIFAKPSQVLVFNPRHPVLILFCIHIV